MITLDFETEAIEAYPNYPPGPVGVAIKYDALPGIYLSWGHPTENNCEEEAARYILKEVWASDHKLLFHNARFDVAVAIKWLGRNDLWTDPLRIHDTMYLIFLNNPLQASLSLKPSAELLLGWKPEEQEAVRDWLILHGIVPSNKKDWGAHISKAPGDLVGKYAIGDVDRTYALYQHLYDRNCGEAYDRERLLAPILNRSELEGIEVDVPALERDVPIYQEAFDRATTSIKRLLDQDNEEFNLDSGAQLAEAIRLHGFGVPDDEWPKTPTGKFSTSRDTLMSVLTHDELAKLLAYRGVLKTLLGTFMKPWLVKALATGGWVHPRWNQVKSDDYGAKTGRLSSSDPNFQNIPTDFDDVTIPDGYPMLPHIRQYVLPDEGEVFVSADFHSQEIRMLGHFAGGAIQDIYCNDPAADVHQVAAEIISEETGLALKRKHTKIVAFSILYGAGVKTMAERMGVTMAEAGQIKRAYLNTLTGVKEFMKDVEARAYAKQSVLSWGGRYLYAPASIIQPDGRVWNKDYVLLNYIIQGSSADQTKQSIINYDRTRKHGRFVATVHDEICISVPRPHLRSEVAILKAAMESGEFCIPMRATVKVGPNWANLKDYNV